MLGCKGLTIVTYFWWKTNEVDKAFDGYIFKTDLLIPSIIQKNHISDVPKPKYLEDFPSLVAWQIILFGSKN